MNPIDSPQSKLLADYKKYRTGQRPEKRYPEVPDKSSSPKGVLSIYCEREEIRWSWVNELLPSSPSYTIRQNTYRYSALVSMIPVYDVYLVGQGYSCSASASKNSLAHFLPQVFSTTLLGALLRGVNLVEHE